MELSPIFEGVMGLLAAIITVYVVPWLKNKLTHQQRGELLALTEIAVAAAQQLYYNMDGGLRRSYVENFLREHGYKPEDLAVSNTIEAVVLKLHSRLEQRA